MEVELSDSLFFRILVVSIGPPVHVRAGLVFRRVWSGLGQADFV